MVGLRGSVRPEVGLFKRAAEEIKAVLVEQGVAGMPIGMDITELPMLFALQDAGLEVRDGQQTMLDARQQEAVVAGVSKWMKAPASTRFGVMSGARNSRGTITVCGEVDGRNGNGLYVGMRF